MSEKSTGDVYMMEGDYYEIAEEIKCSPTSISGYHVIKYDVYHDHVVSIKMGSGFDVPVSFLDEKIFNKVDVKIPRGILIKYLHTYLSSSPDHYIRVIGYDVKRNVFACESCRKIDDSFDVTITFYSCVELERFKMISSDEYPLSSFSLLKTL